MYTHIETSRRSCVPSSVSCWNDLQSNLREADTLLSFRHNLKTKILTDRKIPSYYMKGQRKWSVIHARIRNNCSDLKCDLFHNHLSDDTRCSCGNTEENALHFFFECETYANARLIMFRQTRKYHPLSLNTILHGKLLYLITTTLFFFRQYSNTYKILDALGKVQKSSQTIPNVYLLSEFATDGKSIYLSIYLT